MDVKVGDILKMERGTGAEGCAVKADIVLIASEDEDGVVYVETSQLDGETSIKPRKAHQTTQILTSITDLEKAASIGGGIHATIDGPSNKIYTWQGVLFTHGGVKAPLSTKNIVWRGSSIRKTAWAYGLVIYTGKDTKQGQNLKRTKRKLSFFAKKVNELVAGIFIFKHVLLFPLCILSIVWRNDNVNAHWYITEILRQYSDIEIFFLNYMTYFVLLSFLIPISLFVTVEFCKVNQILLMKWDEKMMYKMPGVGWVGCRPKTSDLNEQLAVVKYVFSDKTGTLTENVMRYMEGCVIDKTGKWRKHTEVNDTGAINRAAGGEGAAAVYTNIAEAEKPEIRYLACMSICHTVVPFIDTDTGKINFEGSSPDEVALVSAAADNQFVLRKRTSKDIFVAIGGTEVAFTILQELEFTPTRKMMSMVIQDESGAIYLLCKGADSSVFKALRPNSLTDEALAQGNDIVVRYATSQYRTLCMAYRTIEKDDYEMWSQKYNGVQTELGKTVEMVDAVCGQIEHDLEMIGIAAYEDKLQDGVPDTIKFLTDSGVVVWMLTGDKLETGIEIGKTCGLVGDAEIVPVHVSKELADNPLFADDAELLDTEREYRRKRRESLVEQKLESALDLAVQQKKKITIAIDGTTLDIIQSQKDRHLEARFMELARSIHSAVCCRLTPGQKGYIVNLFQNDGETALAIGDGANDATMINAAMVGIGIIGLEGSQAELASDYAIPRFRFLIRLLAVHGRYAMYRNARCVCFSFYKNAVLSLCMVYFAVFSAFSGTTFFDSWLLAVKNTIFSFFPPLFMGCYGKDISEEALMDPALGPVLYSQMKGGLYFDAFSITMWAVAAIVHGSLIYWFCFPTQLTDDTDPWSGRNGGLIQTGTYAMTMVVFCVLTKAAIHIHYVNSIQVAGVVGSMLLYPLWLALYAAVPSVFGDVAFYGMGDPLFSDPKHYLYALLAAVGFVLTFDFTGVYLQRKLKPTLRDLCADYYEFRNPPWGKDRPFFGCCADVAHGVLPEITSPLLDPMPSPQPSEEHRNGNGNRGPPVVENVLNPPVVLPDPDLIPLRLALQPVPERRMPPLPVSFAVASSHRSPSPPTSPPPPLPREPPPSSPPPSSRDISNLPLT
eukprot:TRINITY_DN11886_c0_g1_i1.p1 TRINITY_DN11886_c0_g1~~TRINITY_DN11886_c0_g1_i1.p1  ORF type:complete len:1304 (+),score=247.98 TRINITY_DN11886_c0_g1_i1:566-3913(+)